MEKLADYIVSIDISSLWNGRKHIRWHLKPDVNVLSGVNGVGKSTILNKLVARLHTAMNTGEIAGGTKLGVQVEFSPSDATGVRFDVIRNFDRPLMLGEPHHATRMPDARIKTELDWQLYLLGRRYLDYQVNVGNRVIEQLSAGTPEGNARATELTRPKARFQNMVDHLFGETGKTIDRRSNEVSFIQQGDRLTPYQLSSGEKQMLIILLTVLTEDGQPYVLFMDEPEISLHVEWQQQLISLIRELNPRVQIVLTTHSPALIMNGWMDDVTDVDDITCEDTPAGGPTD